MAMGSENSSRAESGHILVADDDEAYRKTLCQFLARYGYDCEAAANGRETLEALRRSPFDLLIVDLEMPGNSDLELIQELSRRTPDLPVILVTGHPTLETAVRCVGLQVSSYLLKPPDLEQLRETIDRLISAHRSQNALRQNCLILLRRLEGLTESSSGEGEFSIDPDHSLPEEARQLLPVLHRVVDQLAVRSGGSPTIPARDEELRAAVRDTVEVLKATRRSFKSRQLGQLRGRLEQLLQID